MIAGGAREGFHVSTRRSQTSPAVFALEIITSNAEECMSTYRALWQRVEKLLGDGCFRGPPRGGLRSDKGNKESGADRQRAGEPHHSSWGGIHKVVGDVQASPSQHNTAEPSTVSSLGYLGALAVDDAMYDSRTGRKSLVFFRSLRTSRWRAGRPTFTNLV